jgi:hypothetical protein
VSIVVVVAQDAVAPPLQPEREFSGGVFVVLNESVGVVDGGRPFLLSVFRLKVKRRLRFGKIE